MTVCDPPRAALLPHIVTNIIGLVESMLRTADKDVIGGYILEITVRNTSEALHSSPAPQRIEVIVR